MPLSDYLERLRTSGLNLLIFKDGEVIFSSGGKGVTPLIEAIDSVGRDRLMGAVTADRIVGRAAVLLNIYLGASEVHAMLITTGAKRALEEHGVKYKFWEETEAIKMRDGVIYCPFESMVQGIEDPGEAYRRIRAKLIELGS
jgi:GMP synthase PP-ATPase subunit